MLITDNTVFRVYFITGDKFMSLYGRLYYKFKSDILNVIKFYNFKTKLNLFNF